MASSDVEIANLALQKLGASRIDAFDQDTPNARSIDSAYALTRDRLLRTHPWNFAIKRASVAAKASNTVWGDLKQYPLPNDFLRFLRGTEAGTGDEERERYWKREGDSVVTEDSSPLQFRYIAQITDPAQFDSLFVDLLATTLAYELCEEITQSTSKKDTLAFDRQNIIIEARRVNAIENPSQDPPEDSWLQARL